MRSRGDVTTRRMTMGALIVGLLVATGGLVSAKKSAHVAPPQSHPHGQTFSEWAADWWPWALEQPTPVNPLIDPTGAQCASGQTGNVWFLAGSLSGGTVTRSCSIPTGTALVFPMLNNFYCAFLNDPPETRTEEFIRAQVAGTAAGTVSASIDGVPVQNPGSFFEESELFEVQLPADNIFGLGPDVVPELLFSPCADAGFYLFVNPLPPGPHTINFQGSLGEFSLNVTYNLTVVPGGH
jgi:hypothetical protein